MDWVRSIDDLGFPRDAAEAYRRCLRASCGLVLVTGQRGAGLTTTLYAGVRELVGQGRKVVTIEDPVEYLLPGVLQLSVAPDFFFDDGIDAARCAGAEAVVVGSLPDRTTISKALAAARSRLVLASFFCMRATEAPVRIAELAASPVEGLLGVFHQRLRVEVEHL